MEKEKEACTVPCSKSVIDDKRCECVNMAKSMQRNAAGIGSVTVSFNYCHRDSRDELIAYLEEKCWKYEEDSIFTDEET